MCGATHVKRQKGGEGAAGPCSVEVLRRRGVRVRKVRKRTLRVLLG